MAHELIAEISKVTDMEVNLMDCTGIIIASTDTNRVGQFHEGARLIIMKRISELPVHYDNEFSGCGKGIGLPIFYNDEIVGVIGVTGEPDEIIQYARLIQKMTEFMVRDMARVRQEGKLDQEKMLFINSWVSGEIESGYEIGEFLEPNGIDPDKPIAFAVMEVFDKDTRNRDAHKLFENRVSPPGTLVCNREDSGILLGNFSSPEKCMECVMTYFTDQYPMENYVCGVGDLSADYHEAAESYHQALKVLEINRDISPGVYLYNDSLFEIILFETPGKYKHQLFSRIFRECRSEDIPDLMKFIRIYNLNNGSINSIASEMFIHKNTVQYKINKLHALTGLDLRVSYDNMILGILQFWYWKKQISW